MSFCSKLSSFWADILQSTSSPFFFSSCSLFRKSGSPEVSRANCCMSVSRGPRAERAENEGTAEAGVSAVCEVGWKQVWPEATPRFGGHVWSGSPKGHCHPLNMVPPDHCVQPSLSFPVQPAPPPEAMSVNSMGTFYC